MLRRLTIADIASQYMIANGFTSISFGEYWMTNLLYSEAVKRKVMKAGDKSEYSRCQKILDGLERSEAFVKKVYGNSRTFKLKEVS